MREVATVARCARVHWLNEYNYTNFHTYYSCIIPESHLYLLFPKLFRNNPPKPSQSTGEWAASQGRGTVEKSVGVQWKIQSAYDSSQEL